jgi:hypothetical protein
MERKERLTGKGKGFMKMHMIIRRFAGTFILASLLLAHYHDPLWLWFTAFVGFNLIQSSFTNFCPLEMILRKMGIGGCGECCAVEDKESSRAAAPEHNAP